LLLVRLMYSIDQIISIIERNGLRVSERAREQLGDYARLLLSWNAKINLMSRKDEADVWRNHILHSLAPALLLPLPETGEYLDIGTGGGLPGIPLAILMPRARFLLCDSIGKKIKAVESMAAELGLANVSCACARVEDLVKSHAVSARIDVFLARAVTALPDLIRWCKPLARDTGESVLIAWKGGDVQSEIDETMRKIKGLRYQVIDMALQGENYFIEQEKKLVVVHFG
jgi:16S rRNA (guanine527-N7)-methyltransferase